MINKRDINFFLHQFGVNSSYTGYAYVIDGILKVLSNPDYMKRITKMLYVDIAHDHHTSVSCVERNIRTIINIMWQSDNADLLYHIFPGNCFYRPTNQKFFHIMYDYFSFNHPDPCETYEMAELHEFQLHTTKYKCHVLEQENLQLKETVKILYETIRLCTGVKNE